MQTLWYLLRLFSSLAFGSLVASLIGKQKFNKITSISLDVILYSLLFFMGINTAQIPNIGSQIAAMGYDALIATLLVVIGTIISSFLLRFFLRNKVSRTERIRQEITLARLKTPLIMITLVVLGLLGAAMTPLFNWFNSSLITYILYALLFLVGMQMVQHEVNLIPLLKSPLMLLLPLSSLVGTYLGALFIPLFCHYSIKQAFALVSGFGWYSLSGVMISSLGDPHLGAVSFLSNLLRETLSFILIPLLATLSPISFSAISVAGATSMDVTLPLLKKSLGERVVPLAIAHGVIMTLLAPLFIPLWMR